jgi:hypothetical protein
MDRGGHVEEERRQTNRRRGMEDFEVSAKERIVRRGMV